MFTVNNVLNFNGEFVRGELSKQRANESLYSLPYLFNELRFSQSHWSSESLRGLSRELLLVANELDKQNKPKQNSATVFLDENKVWIFLSENGKQVLCRLGAQGSFNDVIAFLKKDGWVYQWTHANGEDHYFYKEKQNESKYG
nr:hypothetical protein [Paenibacillus xylanexedens]